MSETSTNWEVGPTLRAMMRNKIGAVLIALQIAVTMAVVVNAAAIIVDRRAAMNRPTVGKRAAVSGPTEARILAVFMRRFIRLQELKPSLDVSLRHDNDHWVIASSRRHLPATALRVKPRESSARGSRIGVDHNQKLRVLLGPNRHEFFRELCTHPLLAGLSAMR